jgi:hypothetical protein
MSGYSAAHVNVKAGLLEFSGQLVRDIICGTCPDGIFQKQHGCQ